MSFSKRQLEEQLAQVAAGRRDRVSGSIQSDVTSEEWKAERRAIEHADSMERLAGQQAKATERAARGAERGQQKLLELSREALALEEERLRDQAMHQAAMLELTEDQHRELVEVHDRQREDQQEQDEAQRAWSVEQRERDEAWRREERERHSMELRQSETRADQALEEQRSQASPSYVAATRLQELREHKKPEQERVELEVLLRPAIAVHESLIEPMREAIAEVSRGFERQRVSAEAQHAAAMHTKTQQDDAHARVLAARQAQLNTLNAEVLRAEEDATELRSKRDSEKVGWSLFAWGTARKTRRETLLSELTEAENRFSEVQQSRDRARLQLNEEKSVAGIHATESLQIRALEDDLPKQLRELRAVVVSVAIQAGAPAVLARLSKDLESWVRSKPRSKCAYDLLTDFEPDFVFFSYEVEPKIDFQMCVVLDGLLENEQTVASYPGLGPLPRGRDLIDLIHKVQKLAEVGQVQKVDDTIAGWAELIGLKNALTRGYFELPSKITGHELHAELVDPMLVEALEAILAADRARISVVQRALRIGYNRAERLIEELGDLGMVTAMRGNGTRDIRYEPAKAWLLNKRGAIGRYR